MKVEEVQKLLHAILIQGKITDKKIGKIAIDTRTMKKGDVFLCMIGKRLDGHQFIEEAIKLGASVIVVSKMVSFETEIPILLVDNTNEAYFTFARYHKEKIEPSVIAITGSVGKTTTKELIANFLKEKYCVLKSEGNFNNHIGVPMTMLKLKPKHEVLILEMGMNHAGEIARLSELAKPNTAVITNIGTSHIGYLKTKKNILKAKMEITEGMEHGTLVLNGNDPYLKKVTSCRKYDVIPVRSDCFHAQIKKEKEYFGLVLRHQKQVYRIKLPYCAFHLLDNIFLALQVGLLYHVSMSDMLQVLEHTPFQLQGRLEHIPFGINQTLINDTYNASFESSCAALSYLKMLPGTKCMVFGDILELGKKGKKIHRKLARIFRKEKEIDYILIGTEVKVMKKYLKNSHYFKTVEDFMTYLSEHPFKQDSILLKASHNMHLDRMIEKLK